MTAITRRLNAVAQRFTFDPDGCWRWNGETSQGYGRLRDKLAHRILYEMCVEPLEDDVVLHHVCGNKLCVNPGHLRSMTQAEHARLHGYQRRAVTHCKRGHPYTPANTLRNSRGWRYCRACHYAKDLERKHTRRLLIASAEEKA